VAAWIFVTLAAVALGAFVYAVARLAPRRERYDGFCATGIAPVGALDHVEAAIRSLDGYVTTRTGDTVTITRGLAIDAETPLADAVEDVLRVKATRAEVGTIVEISGYARPEVIAALRSALAQTPPWTRSP
jgi:hypothetical protein